MPVVIATPVVINGCPAVVPNTLPSGSPAGPARLSPEGRIEWGAGADLVVEAVGELALGDPSSLGIPQGSDQLVEVRGSPGAVMPIGDEGVGVTVITWTAGDCGYTVWLAPAVPLEVAIEYATRL